MVNRKKSKRIYLAHRTGQRQKILDAAEALFIKRGIDPVTIADIAADTRLTRATIYKYFPNRQEIAFAIFKTIISGWHKRNKQVWTHRGNGFQKVEKFLNAVCDHLFQSPKETRFVAEFNYLYAKEWPSNQIIEILDQIVGEDWNLIVQCLRQGIRDGSLRPDLDPDLTMAAIHNLNSSLLGRLGQMGDKLQEESGLGANAIFNEIYKIFINGIKADSGSRQAKSKAVPARSRSSANASVRKFKK